MTNDIQKFSIRFLRAIKMAHFLQIMKQNRYVCK